MNMLNAVILFTIFIFGFGVGVIAEPWFHRGQRVERPRETRKP